MNESSCALARPRRPVRIRLTAQTLDSPSSASRRESSARTIARPDAAPVGGPHRTEATRPAFDLRSALRFAMPWFLAILLWSLLGCSPPHEIVALDGETGAIRWRREVTGRVIGTHANRVFVERNEAIVGLDAGTGQEVWRATIREGMRAVENVLDAREILVLDTNGVVTPIDGSTGARRVESSLPIGAGEIRRVAFAPGATWVQTHDGGLLFCTSHASAADRIAETLGAVTPVSTGNSLVAVLADGSLAAFGLTSASERWRIAALPAAHALEYRDDALWLGGRNGALLSIEPETGGIRFALPDAGTDARLLRDGSNRTAPILLRDGRGLSILDAESGTVTRSIPLTDRMSGATAISRALVVRRFADGAVLGFDRDSGDRRYVTEVGSSRAVTVVVLDPRAPEVSLLD